MSTSDFVLDSDAGLSPKAERLVERLLYALRKRDGAELKSIADSATHAARESSARFVLDGRRRDPDSHALGTVDAIATIADRAAARHERNRQAELLQHKYVRQALVAIGLSGESGLIPSLLLTVVPGLKQAPLVSRLVAKLADAGLLAGGDLRVDGRNKPVRLTPDSLALLDEHIPGWRKHGAYPVDLQSEAPLDKEIAEFDVEVRIEEDRQPTPISVMRIATVSGARRGAGFDRKAVELDQIAKKLSLGRADLPMRKAVSSEAARGHLSSKKLHSASRLARPAK